MSEKTEKIDNLLKKMEKLLKRHNDFSRDIHSLRIEIDKLQNSEKEKAQEKVDLKQQPLLQTDSESKGEGVNPDYSTTIQRTDDELSSKTPSPVKSPKIKLDLEKFIGENLANKVGIVVTIIGIAIGVKYSIENDLIRPLTRIILGYFASIGLLVFGFVLRKKYENYSAVLVSGGIATMYFITFSAYSFFDLISQNLAFLLMVIFTIFAVLAALKYNKQVIAHIGLVGAYSVPFLLSDGSGKAEILFSYMSVINVGVLIISFRKYWKSLFYSSFFLTWLIFFSWYASKYQTNLHFGLTLTFVSVFFMTFYLTFLSYKLIKKEEFKIENIALLLANSFIFYGIGYAILNDHEIFKKFLGFFTICNAIIHFIVCAIIYQQKLTDRNIFYLVSGLALVFIAITIPVQLDGNWVTLLWAGEAALLFWIGRTKNTAFYEKLSYVLMFLAFFSILHDWSTLPYENSPELSQTRIRPFLNINFLSTVLFIAAFGFINLLNRNNKYSSVLNSQNQISIFISFSIPAILFFTLYYVFYLEVANYCNLLYSDSVLSTGTEREQLMNYRNHDLPKFKTIWLINYSLFFLSALSFLNIRKLRDEKLGIINLGLIVLALAVFLTLGLYTLSELRESYLEQTLAQYFQRGVFNIGIRYVSFAFVAIVLILFHNYIQQNFVKRDFKVAFDFLLHASILWIMSSELINWMDIVASTQSYKLGLSILWGVYSLLLVALGIWQKKRHMRIAAIVLFGITLVKLFLYDISHLDTIAKTIAFVSLGILLLIISFLYNKYKHIIW